MSRVRTAGTHPELLVRKALSGRAVRYRLNPKGIVGRPDIFVSRLRLAIFVHGCFWHGHNCRRGKLPTSNAAFWQKKISGNVLRDSRIVRELHEAKIETLVLWTCGLDELNSIMNKVARKYHKTKSA